MSVEEQGNDITHEHVVDETKSMGDSEIQKFYAVTTVLVTGGTGFLGKLLVEKLLRSCPDINKIFLLARPKKGKDSQKRLQEQFEDIVDIMFHGAATVRFDEALKVAVQINVRGTKEMLLMARTCSKLKAFVYISTAYRAGRTALRAKDKKKDDEFVSEFLRLLPQVTNEINK